MRFSVEAILLIGLAFAIEVSGQELTDFWTDNRHINIARFHVLVIDGISASERNSYAANGMKRLLGVFNNDVDDLARKFSGGQPNGLRVGKLHVTLARSRNDVLNGLDQLSERLVDDTADDVFFVYVLAHGNVQRINDQNVTTLTLNNGSITRDEIIQRLRPLTEGTGRTARLGILATDNCNVTLQSGQNIPISANGALIWRALYFGQEGFVDLQSTDPATAQAGYIIGDIPVFLRAFSLALTLSPEEIERKGGGDTGQAAANLVTTLDQPQGNAPRDTVVSWTEFETRLRDKERLIVERYQTEFRATAGDADAQNFVQNGQSFVLNDDATTLPPRP